MKHYIALLAAAAMLSACEEIGTDERFRPLGTVETKSCVLVEDFTGQNCVNCPEAHKVLEQLVEQYGEAVIPVSIHTGAFAIPVDYARYQGLMQPEAAQYNDMFSIQDYPKGIINHAGAPLTPSDWSGEVRKALAQAPVAAIDLSASYDGGADSLIRLSATLTPLVDAEAHVQFYILEDSIVARQKDMSGKYIMDYVHNHVYRCSPNGVGGTAVSLKAMTKNSVDCEQKIRNAKYETWNLDHIWAVAYVYTANGGFNAVKTKLKIQ